MTPNQDRGCRTPTQCLRQTLTACSAVTGSRLTNSTYRGDREATDGDLEDGEQWGPSFSQKGFEARASYPLRRGSARQGSLQEAKVSRCSASPRAPLPPPQEQEMSSQDLLGHLVRRQDPEQSSRDRRRRRPGALCSPQT